MNFTSIREPIKILGTYISYDQQKTNGANFFSRIQKIKTTLNMWQTGDLSLYAKTIGVSHLIYTASMLTVPENVIQKTQAAFLWRNKKDKIKRKVIYQPLVDGGLNFINFRTMSKSLRLSWIGRLLDGSDANWKAIPNHYFNRHGGLTFLLNCNYDTKCIDSSLPLFYKEMLEYFQELVNMYDLDQRWKFVLWNNREIKIEGKTLFWKTWFEKGIFLVQDLLNEDGKFLSLQEFQDKFDLEIYFLQYFQMIAAIPSEIKCSAYKTQITPDDLFKMEDILQLTKNPSLSLAKMRCKHYYKLFNENCTIVPTGVKAWEQLFPDSFISWKANLQNIYKITKDNKLRQFLFKLLHRITVTKRELERFKITVDHQCSCWASQIHICGIVNIRIAMNYLVKLKQTEVFPSKLQ